MLWRWYIISDHLVMVMVKWTDCLIACWRDSFVIESGEYDNVYTLVLYDIFALFLFRAVCGTELYELKLLWHLMKWNKIYYLNDIWNIFGIWSQELLSRVMFWFFSLVFLYCLCYDVQCAFLRGVPVWMPRSRDFAHFKLLLVKKWALLLHYDWVRIYISV